MIERHLRVLTRRDVALDAVLDSAAVLGEAVALLATPAAFVVRRADGGQLWDPSGKAARPAGVFEARLFSERGELRWLAGGGSGRAALLLDVGPDALPDGWERGAGIVYLDRLTRRYLLWGRASGSPVPGWTRLDEARVGPRDVPAEGGPYLRLEAWEYVGARHGNACVLAERLVAIRPYRPARAEEGGDGRPD